MSIDAYECLVTSGSRALENLAHVLRRGEAWASEHNVEPAVMLETRLIADMLPLRRQVQIATDMVTRGAARLTGSEPQSFADDETDFAALHARIERAIALLRGFRREQFEGCETREIVLAMRSGEMRFDGQSYLLGFVMPNLYFHCTTTYNLLRKMGVAIGKADFFGGA